MKLLTTLLAFLFSISVIAQTNPDKVHVDTYRRHDGTIVQSHDKTAPNSTNRDNWSTKPNSNPETGKAGTVRPDNKPAPTYHVSHSKGY
jgi:hypothetical protein